MAEVLSVSKSIGHNLSKISVEEIVLIEGEGVEGDAHRGKNVKHRSMVKKDSNQPNLRQVHLIHFELIEELQAAEFDVAPATLGENITTYGIELLSLPTGTILSIGSDVKLKVTGLRTPCSQLDNYQKGLTAAVLDRDEEGSLIRRSGIMSIVVSGGIVRRGDCISVQYPKEPHRALCPV